MPSYLDPSIRAAALAARAASVGSYPATHLVTVSCRDAPHETDAVTSPLHYGQVAQLVRASD